MVKLYWHMLPLWPKNLNFRVFLRLLGVCFKTFVPWYRPVAGPRQAHFSICVQKAN
jgi:hypothetical protein